MDKSRRGECKSIVPTTCLDSSFFELDPVIEQSLRDQRSCVCKRKEKPKVISSDIVLKPSLNTRVNLTTHDYSIAPGTKYVVPKSRKQRRLDRERRRQYEESLHFCKRSVMRMASPLGSTTLNIQFQTPSAEIKKAKVIPRKASITPSEFYPEPPDTKELTLHEPKSGTFINVTKKKRRKRRRRKKEAAPEPAAQGPTIEELIAQELATIQEIGEGAEGEGEGGDAALPESYLTKVFRRKVSQLSKTTSYKSKDYKGEGEVDETEKEDRFINTLVQKFRRDSEIKRWQKPKRKIKSGTLENFSFTKLKQPTLKTFYYGVKLGTVHQGNLHFPAVSRNKQGICMPVAAYCFSILKHPDRWTQADIDDVLIAGNELFMESADTQHMHGQEVHLRVANLRKYCKIGKRKVRFVVSEPEVSGMVRSDDIKIYNLTKAINVFFAKYSAGILETQSLCVAIWKDKNYYFFDPGPRTIDLYTHPNGTALMANFYDTTAIVTVLLDRSNLENQHFIIYSIQAYRVLLRDAEEVDSTGVIPEADNFQVLDEEKAVVLGSFDLADMCFGFSRNKQALTIALVALVYSKITPPSSWHKGTLDKIIIIGNQLFLECIENDSVDEVKIEDLPAVFTIGPYVIEVYLSPNRFVNFMFKKSKCKLHEALEKFFETNSNAIVQIDNCVIAVWKQRNIYHCVDPYSRNNEGFKCRDGTACVSMHTTMESLTGTISKNWDQKDMIFHVHALKVCKIHRDPNLNELFPRCLTMGEYPTENFKKQKMRRGKKKAVKQAVTIDYETRAALLDGLPDESILEVGSTVRSIGMDELSSMCHRKLSAIKLQMKPDTDFVADLNSPSLSDTQIEPEPPEDTETAITFMDLDSFDLTAEEKDMMKRGEGGEGGEGRVESKRPDLELAEGAKGEGEGSDEWYMAATEYTQVGSQSLLSRLSAEVGTDEFRVEIPDEEVPVVTRDIRAISRRRKEIMKGTMDGVLDLTPEPDVTLSEELAKETNFVSLPDGSQIILGGTNMAAFGTDLEIMAPFVCIMAGAVARKYAIDSWSKDVVDYVLKCGSELHKNSPTRYDQNYKLEIPKISLGKTDFSIRVNYIFDTFIKPRVLAMAIGNMLFPQWRAGILVTPTYSCALFYKNHLYYLYDGFANNEVGLGRGVSNDGVAFLARFYNINTLVARILHNKAKREEEENVEYNRFVLSSCYVKLLPRESEDDMHEKSEEEEDQQVEGGDQREPVEFHTYKKPKEEEPRPPPKMGYHLVNKLCKIEGTRAVGGEKDISEDLKEDYFVCLCACLMLLNNPIKKWDDRRIDEVIDIGIHLYTHVDDVRVCSRKIIKNLLVDDYIFDIATYRVEFATYHSRRSLKAGIEAMLKKKHHTFIIQFPNRCYALSIEDDTCHLFDPSDSGKATWTRYTNFRKFVRRIRSGLVKGCEGYNFHCFEIMSITKAPKHVVISNRSKKYTIPKGRRGELICRPFHEEVCWLETDPIPWSWKVNKVDLPVWNNWFVDYPDDLFSIYGSISPLDPRFPEETRRKQTLGNLVVAIGMTQIYDFVDWNANIMDSILINGDIFFSECIKDIADENYEVAFEDVKKTCTIFPYSFQVEITPVVEGTMFLVRLKQFNLYKALRLFFDDYAKRFGLIYVTKGARDKKVCAFGKTNDSEYFFYDCETLGPPMYVEKDVGVPYMLRTTTVNRLLHVMTLTLRGGDFYIFEVLLSDLTPVEAE